MITNIEKSLGHKTRWHTDFGLMPQKFVLKYAPVSAHAIYDNQKAFSF